MFALKNTTELISGCQWQIEKIPLSHSTNILSVDLEYWPGSSCRTEVNYLLDLFSQKETKATFFVLASAIEKDTDLLRRIDAEGHEIATHGWKHVPLYERTKEEFRQDIVTSINILSDIIGKPIMGFRAPLFSIVKNTLWALDILSDAGIKYDSSIFPIAGDRYGMPDFPRSTVRIQWETKSIIECPLSTLRGFNQNWPVAGGGYFRLLPHFLIKKAIRRVNLEGCPFIVYCHPYEFCLSRLRYPPFHKSLSKWKLKQREFKANLFRKSMRYKLTKILDEFTFSCFREILADAIKP